jgi:endonuclease/exonuclease/phosphatase (EEP) superfamily protein YafD
MAILQVIGVILGLSLVAATLLPLIRSEAWWIRVFDFPRLQIAILLAIVLAASAALFDANQLPGLLFLLTLAMALAYQLWRIRPYTLLASPQVVRRPGETASRVRLLTANVLMENRRADDFIALVRESDPDLIIVAETDHWWDTQLAKLDCGYPFSVKHPLHNTYGMHLFSKLELGATALQFLVEDDVPSIYAAVRLRSGAWFDFYGVHPKPPRPGQDTEQREAELLIIGRAVKRNGRPAVVAGDLNDVAWSRSTNLFQKISGLIDPRVGRGLFSTFHAGYPGLRWPLDHVFHSRDFTLVEMRRLRSFGSDHFPMLVELCYSPTAIPMQEAPQADGEDREEAVEKIAQVR